MLYLRPLYLRASGGRIPELKRVIVAYQDQIVMEDTLDESLARLFGSEQRPAPGALPAGAVAAQVGTQQPADVAAATASAPVGPLAAPASEHYRRALGAQRDGNWALYGQEIERLGEVLARLDSGQGVA